MSDEENEESGMNVKQLIKLPEAQKDLEFPLMKALEQRRSKRKWNDEPLSEQELSNLLWAACGITKEKYGRVKCKRTAPSACNAQEIRVYVLRENGVYLYDEEEHALVQTLSKDIREHIGSQKMMKAAPMGLVYVADLSRMTGPFMRSEEAKRFSAWVDTGFISQNVYLYCTAANLGTVVLAMIKREKLRELMQLEEHEKIVLTQVVGHLA
jgi:SagB-type dehydrogenase family enzyme